MEKVSTGQQHVAFPSIYRAADGLFSAQSNKKKISDRLPLFFAHICQFLRLDKTKTITPGTSPSTGKLDIFFRYFLTFYKQTHGRLITAALIFCAETFWRSRRRRKTLTFVHLDVILILLSISHGNTWLTSSIGEICGIQHQARKSLIRARSRACPTQSFAKHFSLTEII